MNFTETVNAYMACEDEKRAYVLLSMLEEEIKDLKDSIKVSLENDEIGSTSFEDLGKMFNLMEIQKSTLKVDEIKSKLSDEEIRSVYKPTDKDLTTLKRKDLKELKDVTTVRQIRVTTIKVEEKIA